MTIILSLFSTMFFSFFIFLGLMIWFVIRKSSSKQPDSVLNSEKQSQLAKLISKRGKLNTWNTDFLYQITNMIDYTFTKSFTRIFKGYINTYDNSRVIAFRRVDRGFTSTITRIAATTSNAVIYLDKRVNDVLIEWNGAYLGKIDSENQLLDSRNQPIGLINRTQSSPVYEVYMFNEKLAEIAKNSDRRSLFSNPHYDRSSGEDRMRRNDLPIEQERFLTSDVSYNNMLQLFRHPNENEYQWLLVLVIYELAYYGIDFTR